MIITWLFYCFYPAYDIAAALLFSLALEGKQKIKERMNTLNLNLWKQRKYNEMYLSENICLLTSMKVSKETEA